MDGEQRPSKECNECGSAYFVDASKTSALCPECAHHLYGYPNCSHNWVNGHCSLCGWDGSRSEYIRKVIRDRSR